jgi:hypothetical protein
LNVIKPTTATGTATQQLRGTAVSESGESKTNIRHSRSWPGVGVGVGVLGHMRDQIPEIKTERSDTIRALRTPSPAEPQSLANTAF